MKELVRRDKEGLYKEWQVAPVILARGTLRQEDCLEFKANLGQSEPLSQHPRSTPYKTLFGVRPRPKGASHCEKIGDLGAHSGSPEISRHQSICWTQRRLVWVENRVRGRISEGLWPEWRCQMYVCQVNVCQVKWKLLAVKGAVSSPSYLSSKALEFGSWLPLLPLVQTGYGHQGAQPSWESLVGSSGITEVKEQRLA